jgi:CopG family nickel-responsive transcriptional regulator
MQEERNNITKNGKMVRFGVSADSRLLEKFDELLNKKGYVNRSEAIRDIMRDQLVEFSHTDDDKEMIGTINLVYKHGLKALAEKIAELQHHSHTHIISSLHVHLDGESCFEVLVVRGKVSNIKEVADRLIGIKGIIHGKLTMCTKGEDIY